MVAFSNANVGGANATTVNIAWPATVAGYTALLLWSAQSTMTQSDPGNFTLQQSQVQPTGALNSRFLTRNCDGTESGNITLTTSVANKITGCLLVYSGLHPTNPVDVATPRNESVAGTTHINPAVTTGFDDCVICTVIAERSSNGTSAYTPGAGFTNKRAEAPQTGTGMTITTVADDGLAPGRPAGTPVTPPAWTSANTFSTGNVATWTISLRPALATGKAPAVFSQYAAFF